MEEFDVIQALLEVESEAEGMVADAQKTADEKIAVARARADEAFRTRYAAFVADLEKKEVAEKKVIEERLQKELESYKDELEKSKIDKDSFCELLSKILSE